MLFNNSHNTGDQKQGSNPGPLCSPTRSLWPSDIFGSDSDDAVQTLLHIYFRHHTLGQTGCLAVLGGSGDLSQASRRLMELNLQIRQALSQEQGPARLTRPSMVSVGL